MEHIYHIRYEYFDVGKSIRQIAKETGHDRATVKKYVEKENFNQSPTVKRTRSCRSDAYCEQIKKWLKEDEDAPRKQRHTARRVYQRLVEEASLKDQVFDLSERTVCRIVASIKKELGQVEMVALPLLHPPGEAQVDFGETTFIERGISYTGYHLAVTFPHSDAKFTQLFKGQNSDCLEQGLIDIFCHIGRVPDSIRFDNMSTVVKSIKALGEREVTERFRRLQCHFGFKSNFCNPSAGHEKGSVENYVGYSRRNYFVPVPEFDDLEVYNKNLLLRCEAELDREHYKHERKVRDLFEEDKRRMKPLPSYPYETYHYVPAMTNNYGMVKYKTNSYSTAGNLRRCEVTLKVGAHNVTILDGTMRPVVTHKRLYGANKESMIWSPYLNVLAKRPNALRYSSFFEQLPEPLHNFIAGCSLPEKKTLLTELSRTSQKAGLPQAVGAMTDALEFAPRDAESLLAAYAFVLNGPQELSKNEMPEHIPTLPEYEISLTAYKALLGGAICNKT